MKSLPGAADRSYGLQVARLAGLPGAVVERARTILSELERTDRESPKQALLDDLPLVCSSGAYAAVSADERSIARGVAADRA